MASLPYMPFFVAEYLLDAGHLSDEEHGAYLRLLCMAWASPECRLPNDDAWLARRLSRPIETIAQLYRPILAEFFQNNGEWISPRYDHLPPVDWALHPSRILGASWPKIRTAILQRDGEVCCYCGETEGPFEVDHRLPRSRGGTNAVDNLCVACRRCNRSKRALTAEEWLGESA